LEFFLHRAIDQANLLEKMLGLGRYDIKKAVKVLYDQQNKTVQEIADDLSISRATAHKFLKIANAVQERKAP